jgi:hypothetical protein
MRQSWISHPGVASSWSSGKRVRKKSPPRMAAARSGSERRQRSAKEGMAGPSGSKNCVRSGGSRKWRWKAPEEWTVLSGWVDEREKPILGYETGDVVDRY